MYKGLHVTHLCACKHIVQVPMQKPRDMVPMHVAVKALRAQSEHQGEHLYRNLCTTRPPELWRGCTDELRGVAQKIAGRTPSHAPRVTQQKQTAAARGQTAIGVSQLPPRAENCASTGAALSRHSGRPVPPAPLHPLIRHHNPFVFVALLELGSVGRLIHAAIIICSGTGRL